MARRDLTVFSQAIPALQEFVRGIDGNPSLAEGWEELDQIVYENEQFSASLAAKIELEHCLRLVWAFGSALTCRFYLHREDLLSPNENPVLLDVRQGINQSDIDHFRKRIQACQTVSFLLAIDKLCMLRDQNISSATCTFHLYFFSKSLAHLFRGETTGGVACNARESSRALEDSLWSGGHKGKVVILVMDRDVFLNGKYLAILGGTFLPQWQDIIPETTPDFARLEAIYQNCRSSVTWDERWISQLTPLHLKLEEIREAGGSILPALQIQLLNLIVLYTANRTAGGDAEWCATYADDIHAKEILLLSPAQKHVGNQALHQIESFYEVFNWAYESQWPRDRIPFVQSAIAQELVHNSGTDAYQLLLDRSRPILATLDRHWNQFTHKKIQAYTEEERKLEEFVVKTVDAFAERITAMVKAVSDTMLAAIAALFGSVIAAGFGSDNFNPSIFSIGMVAYSLYVLAFPLLYSMSNQWTHYKALHESMEAGVKRFKEELDEDEVDKIVGNRLSQSNQRFRSWFLLTIAVYVIAIALGLAATLLVPFLFAPTS